MIRRASAEVAPRCVDAAGAAANQTECEVENARDRGVRGYRFSTHRTRPCRLAARALERGRPRAGRSSSPAGGADANVFNAAGVPCVNLCNGMREIHTADEHIAVGDLHAMVDVTLALVEAARTADAP